LGGPGDAGRHCLTLIHRFLEFHDSDLLAVDSLVGATVVRLVAYVHQWERSGDSGSRGTGWMQPCILKLVSAQVETSPTTLPSSLSDGVLRSPTGVGSDGTLTLPSVIEGPCTLELETTEGERLRAVAASVTLEPSGPAVFVEDLPADMAPDS